MAIKPATKRELVAEVFVKDRQAEYLALQETGGTRQPAKQALVIPGKDASLNSYGNLPRARCNGPRLGQACSSARCMGMAGSGSGPRPVG
ncbi:hypothetical protein E2C06_33595 [Dankookia rubra]|uniref:Uncharacterized protein n=1 Tax=Dankookia rubra TaxID=1442381 RepID=A0A4R5Q5U5_9PROT|nr:hypothetical protein [Dankookia rubra]TDH58250.1 hypothetical protein E2C06_33595 [Dankookia rubra]